MKFIISSSIYAEIFKLSPHSNYLSFIEKSDYGSELCFPVSYLIISSSIHVYTRLNQERASIFASGTDVTVINKPQVC